MDVSTDLNIYPLKLLFASLSSFWWPCNHATSSKPRLSNENWSKGAQTTRSSRNSPSTCRRRSRGRRTMGKTQTKSLNMIAKKNRPRSQRRAKTKKVRMRKKKGLFRKKRRKRSQRKTRTTVATRNSKSRQKGTNGRVMSIAKVKSYGVRKASTTSGTTWRIKRPTRRGSTPRYLSCSTTSRYRTPKCHTGSSKTREIKYWPALKPSTRKIMGLSTEWRRRREWIVQWVLERRTSHGETSSRN